MTSMISSMSLKRDGNEPTGIRYRAANVRFRE